MSSLFQAGISPGCVTGVGSLPFIDPDEAVAFVAEHCPQLPFWPQLPRRTAGEGVIGQGMGALIEYLEPSARPYCWAVRRGPSRRSRLHLTAVMLGSVRKLRPGSLPWSVRFDRVSFPRQGP